MENTINISIEELSEKLDGNLWIKGDLKRIYLNTGWNTRKMSTKTFVFFKDNEILVSCNIECPSQPLQWILSQEKEVEKRVYSTVEYILNPEEDGE